MIRFYTPPAPDDEALEVVVVPRQLDRHRIEAAERDAPTPEVDTVRLTSPG